MIFSVISLIAFLLISDTSSQVFNSKETGSSSVNFWIERAENVFLASQDAIEGMSVTDWLTVSTDLTDVTLVSDDTL